MVVSLGQHETWWNTSVGGVGGISKRLKVAWNNDFRGKVLFA
jgi:hypothetical protein